MSRKGLTAALFSLSALLSSCQLKKENTLDGLVFMHGTTERVEYRVGELVKFADDNGDFKEVAFFGKTKSPEILALKSTDFTGERKEEYSAEHVLLQYEENLSAGDRVELGKSGVKVIAPLTSHAYIARISETSDFDLPGKRLKKLVHLRPEDKVSDLFASDYSWASDEVNTVLNVTFFPDVGKEEAASLLESYGGDLLESLELGDLKVHSVSIPDAALGIFVGNLAKEDAVQFIEPLSVPLSHTNYVSRDVMNVDALQEEMPWLTGEGMVIGIYDAGLPVAGITDLYGRVVGLDNVFVPSGHATHVSCTALGNGVSSLDFLTMYCESEDPDEDDLCAYVTGGSRTIDPEIATNLFRGVATLAEGVASFHSSCDPYCFYNTPATMAGTYLTMIVEYGASSITNSVGSNVSSNGYPCEINGNADLTSRIVDMFVHGAASGIIPPVSIVYAAGNERGSTRCTGKSEGYGTLGIPAAGSKNAIIVGASELHDGELVPSFYESFGPSDDGRLGLTVMALGGGWEHPVMSCLPFWFDGHFITLYGGNIGTSMAAPAVEGVVALLYQYAAVEHFVMSPSLAKVVLVNTTFDLGEPTPNYKVGFGHVDAYKAMKTLEARLFATGELLDGEMHTYYVLMGKERAKASMAYTDLPGVPNAAKVLVNDLDFEIVSPLGKVYLPVVQASSLHDTYLIRKRDDVNNVEQVTVHASSSREGEIWKVNVKGYSVVEGPQEYSLAFDVPFYRKEKAFVNATDDFEAELVVDVYKKSCETDTSCTFDYVHTAFREDVEVDETFDLAAAFPGYLPSAPGYYRMIVSFQDDSGKVILGTDGNPAKKNFDFYVH